MKEKKKWVAWRCRDYGRGRIGWGDRVHMKIDIIEWLIIYITIIGYEERWRGVKKMVECGEAKAWKGWWTMER